MYILARSACPDQPSFFCRPGFFSLLRVVSWIFILDTSAHSAMSPMGSFSSVSRCLSLCYLPGMDKVYLDLWLESLVSHDCLTQVRPRSLCAWVRRQRFDVLCESLNLKQKPWEKLWPEIIWLLEKILQRILFGLSLPTNSRLEMNAIYTYILHMHNYTFSIFSSFAHLHCSLLVSYGACVFSTGKKKTVF